jgi:hypothetical protein
MPDFPGISESAHCRDWEPGVPIDLARIREQDERWWEERRGTPKAFLGLSAAHERFVSRFGELTAARFPPARESASASTPRAELSPADGLFFRELAPHGPAGRSANDFGGLFLGLSFFLVLAAALLTALGFGFGVESRAREIGTLRALGFAPRSIAAQLVLEALPLAVVGSLGGAWLGLAATRALLFGLATVWKSAVGGAELSFHVASTSVVFGALGSIVVAVLAMALALRKLVSCPVPELLASRAGFLEREARALERGARGSLALVALGVLALLLLWTRARSAAGPELALYHFGAGGALLVILIAASRTALAMTLRSSDPARLTLVRMGVRNAARRPGRSLAIVTLFAAVLFLLATLAVHQHSDESSSERTSGTGGFALLGRTALPLYHSLASPESREELGLTEGDLGSAPSSRRARGRRRFLLELAAPEHPRLLGVDPRELAERGAFQVRRARVAATLLPWLLLGGRGTTDFPRRRPGDDRWQLHRAVGDESTTDERDQTFRVPGRGALRFRSARQFVVSREAPRASAERLARVPPRRRGSRSARGEPTAVKKLSDVGLGSEPTTTRLATLRAVQTPPGVQVLSALGLVLGSLGLGLLVLRNGLERRGEYALLQVLGYERRALFTSIASEHLWLFAAGALSGTLAALATVLPSIVSRGIGTPSSAAFVLFGLSIVAGALAIAVASTWALRSLDARILRMEG